MVSDAACAAVRRLRLIDPQALAPQARHARQMLALLLTQDGSTTRLCERIAGGPVDLHVRRQETTVDVPPSVRAQLRGERFLERITSITAHGEVMMDNLSYIALEGLEAPVECALREGRTPIGHLLNQWWVRRETVDDAGELAERLWRVVGLPDAEASRCYRIDTPQGPRMLITETYRRGMLMAPR